MITRLHAWSAFAILGMVVLGSLFVPALSSKAQLKAGEHAIAHTYNLHKALAHFRASERVRPNEEALYNIARAQYILGYVDDAIATIEQFKERYPHNKRIHYIAGLTHGVAGDLEQAEQGFRDFIASGLSTWPGHLDLAWILFQQGKPEEARDELVFALETFGENVWLHTSLSGVYVALGNKEQAQDHVRRARELFQTLTVDEWADNYAFNNPAGHAMSMSRMSAAIDVNASILNGVPDAQRAAHALGGPEFIATSPKGFAYGVVASACGNSGCSTVSCTATNACGQSNSGTRNTCGGSCSASAPALPSGYGNSCSATNACGQSNAGTIGCSGTCTASAPSLPSGYGNTCSATNACGASNVGTIDCSGTCSASAPPNPPGYGNSCTAVNACGSNSGTILCDGSCSASAPPCPDPEGTLSALSQLVIFGNSGTVTWSTEYTLSCTVTGDNGDSWTGTSGSEETSPLTAPTIFTLDCDSGALTASTTILVAPRWQEF